MGFWGQNGSDQNFSIPLSIRYGFKNHVLGHTALPRKIGDIESFLSSFISFCLPLCLWWIIWPFQKYAK